MNSEDTVKRLQKYQRNIEKTKRSKKMTIEDVIKKALIPMISMVFWLWMVKTIMGVTGNTDLFMFLFLAGLPFGIHKMCIILIPRGYDVGGTVGMIALSVIVGGLLGSLMIPYYIVRAIYVTIRYIVKR